MDYQPKTRQELKGRDKRAGKPYSSKHVRQQERLAEKKNQDPGTSNSKKKSDLKKN
jgi:hypothetical protein